ncbi:MAG: hypothetical protein J1F69_05605 [Clostridiales bacterium]|nr:hypothetical protein [Clostridiales bacterium]
MKKFTKPLAMAVSAVMATSLIACGGNENNKPKGGNDNDEVYDATVSATEWVSALSFNGVTNIEITTNTVQVTTYKGTADDSRSETLRGMSVYTFNQSAIQMHSEVASLGSEHNEINNRKFFYGDGKQLRYDRNGKRLAEKDTIEFVGDIVYNRDDWWRSEYDSTQQQWQEYLNGQRLQMLYPASKFSQYYSEFTYDEATQSYELNDDSKSNYQQNGGTVNLVKVKFKNKKVIGVYYEYYTEQDLSDFEYEVSGIRKRTNQEAVTFSYGKFVIEEPTDYTLHDFEGPLA